MDAQSISLLDASFTHTLGSLQSEGVLSAIQAAVEAIQQDRPCESTAEFQPSQVNRIIASIPSKEEGGDDVEDSGSEIPSVSFSNEPVYLNPPFAKASKQQFITSIHVRGPLGGPSCPFFDVTFQWTAGCESGLDETAEGWTKVYKFLPVAPDEAHAEVLQMVQAVIPHYNPSVRHNDPLDAVTVTDRGDYFYVCIGQSSDSGALYVSKTAPSHLLSRPPDLERSWGPGSGMNISYAPSYYQERRMRLANVKLMAQWNVFEGMPAAVPLPPVDSVALS